MQAEEEARLNRLCQLSLTELGALDDDVLAPVLDGLLIKIIDPGSSISGYNPQRLD